MSKNLIAGNENFEIENNGSIVRIFCPDGTIIENKFPSAFYQPKKWVGYVIGWWLSSNRI